MIGTPEVNSLEIKEDTAFFVIASDGVWEFLTSQAVVDLVRAHGALKPWARLVLLRDVRRPRGPQRWLLYEAHQHLIDFHCSHTSDDIGRWLRVARHCIALCLDHMVVRTIQDPYARRPIQFRTAMFPWLHIARHLKPG